MATQEELALALSGIKEDNAAMLTAVQTLSSSMDTVKANIQALKDQIAQGSPVTQEQLDSLTSDAQAVDASGDEVKSLLASVQEKVTSAES